MRRLLGRRGSLYPSRTCHFCCVESWIVPPHPIQNAEDERSTSNFATSSSSSSSSSSSRLISTGSVGNWFCSSCQCWNRADPDQIGGIATWDQKMNDDKQNTDNFQKRAIPAPTSTLSTITSSSFPSKSFFCHSCQTNQTLILSILANGNVDEMDDQAIQDWQTSLESRYPPVCSLCHENVIDRIRSADKMARRLIWNGWLKRSRERGTPSSRIKNRSETTFNGNRPPNASFQVLSGIIWNFQCLAYLSGAILGIYTSWRSIDMGTFEHRFLLGALSTCHIVSLHWDPTLPMQQRLKQRLSPETSIKILGRSRFSKGQYCLLTIHYAMLMFPLVKHFIPSTNMISHHLQLSLSIFATAIQCAILINSFTQLQVMQPHSISLKSKLSNLNSPIKANDDSFSTDPALGFLSLGSELHPPIKRGSVSHQKSQETQIQKDEEKEEMDWCPTPDVSLIGNDFQLGPQRFFEPDRRTGLEELLQTQLALEERKANLLNAGQRTASATTSSRWTMGIIAIAITLFAMSAAVLLGPNQMKEAVHQMTNHYAPMAIKKQVKAFLGTSSIAINVSKLYE